MSYLKHRSNESIEDYLETIFQLKNRIGQVRSIDVVREMNFSKASVSIAMKKLREKDYITIDESGYISLTESGLAQAIETVEKHTILSKWLISIGVDPEIAIEDACRMEHDISQDTYLAIKNHFENTSK